MASAAMPLPVGAADPPPLTAGRDLLRFLSRGGTELCVLELDVEWPTPRSMTIAGNGEVTVSGVAARYSLELRDGSWIKGDVREDIAMSTDMMVIGGRVTLDGRIDFTLTK